MKNYNSKNEPSDSIQRKSIKPVICYPLRVEVYSFPEKELENWKSPEVSTYNGEHKL